MAESEGFEPPDLLQSTVFKTAAFDRSANSPIRVVGGDYNVNWVAVIRDLVCLFNDPV